MLDFPLIFDLLRHKIELTPGPLLKKSVDKIKSDIRRNFAKYNAKVKKNLHNENGNPQILFFSRRSRFRI